MAWSFVGGSAAWLLAVPTDLVLLAAGVLSVVTVLGRRLGSSASTA